MSTAGKVIHCKAAVCWAKDEPLVIESISVEPPRNNEVRIRMVSTSFCHSDLHGIKGMVIPGMHEAEFPTVFGHEGAGIVESVGPAVKGLKPGDAVIPLFAAQCGECPLCAMDGTNLCIYAKDTRAKGLMSDGTSRLSCKGKTLTTFLGCATFSEYFVADEPCVAKINPKADLTKVGVAGCCIPTGVGAARAVAQVAAGSTCAVWGLGAVGLSAVLGCKLAGASTIIGVDISPEKAELAKKFGCTEFIDPTKLDKPIQKVLQERSPFEGCDFTFESIGNVHTMRAAYESVRPAGGVCTVLGVSSDPEKFMQVHPIDLLGGKNLRGCYFGGLRFRLDLPKLVDEIVEGKIDCGLFITDTIKHDQINWAIDQMKAGKGIRYALLY
ncbi:alcohol dehydrogenase class-3-like isoform X2 [Frankliniella occidentalis]|uniref:Alcohol dehydrogenase class-3-like isoform X2 n=1 Tax=Frankliniella occidentalis TaxID=133901 RepID=A0A9C6U3H1_FRAOC|nr:alcohol dehydrogenase class-3-like isoform X2 [Frankliniella occidentalis]